MSKILSRLSANQALRRKLSASGKLPERPISQVGEFGLIDILKKNITLSKEVVAGIGDDCAVIEKGAGEYLLLTTDMLVENIHFTRDMNPRAIGHKALACNVSDIAAMGGTPTFAVVSLGLPKDLETRFVQQIYAGINRLASQYGVSIVGGDTNKSEKIIINVTLLGKVKKNQLVKRSGAQPGDVVFVTGPLGGSLKTGKHLTFKPRVQESQFLIKHFKPNAMIDISDGLLADLNHILKASRVGAILEEEKIPRNKTATLRDACLDGEDFELLFTLAPTKARRVVQQKLSGIKFYPIGKITSNKDRMELKTIEGFQKRLAVTGFAHF